MRICHFSVLYGCVLGHVFRVCPDYNEEASQAGQLPLKYGMWLLARIVPHLESSARSMAGPTLVLSASSSVFLVSYCSSLLAGDGWSLALADHEHTATSFPLHAVAPVLVFILLWTHPHYCCQPSRSCLPPHLMTSISTFRAIFHLMLMLSGSRPWCLLLILSGLCIFQLMSQVVMVYSLLSLLHCGLRLLYRLMLSLTTKDTST